MDSTLNDPQNQIQDSSELERRTLAKVVARLVPFMFLLYVFCILDRGNISYAQLTMKKDLHLSDTLYGTASGIFFWGYFIFEIPSNLILEKVGPRRWIARIMFSWGIVASLMMFVNGAFSLSVVRFMLGVAEAGFFPGMVIYLTYWFPAVIRARVSAYFMVATTIGSVVGGPLAGLLLKMNGVGGVKGWQWIFLAEGIPSFLLGFAVLKYLTNRPEEADWLQPEERTWLIGQLAKEKASRLRRHNYSVFQAITNWKVLHLTAYFFIRAVADNGFGAFAPQILKNRSGWSDTKVLMMGTIPAIVGSAVMILAAVYSDRLRERRLFVSLGQLLQGVWLGMVAFVRSPAATLGAQTVAGIGGNGANAPFWAIATSFLSGTAAAGGIAFMNSVGNLGGYFGPQIVGYVKDKTGGFEIGIYICAGCYLAASLIAALLKHDKKVEYGEDEEATDEEVLARSASPGGASEVVP